jgi:iron-sulfur cluster assembly protein
VGALLALTDDAVQAVTEIISTEEESGSGPPAVAGLGLGLRLVAERVGAGTTVEAGDVSLPAEEDEVVVEQGVRLLLDPAAASLLDDKLLDATVEGNEVEFGIVDQIDDGRRQHRRRLRRLVRRFRGMGGEGLEPPTPCV